jgi:hypothetical protein
LQVKEQVIVIIGGGEGIQAFENKAAEFEMTPHHD